MRRAPLFLLFTPIFALFALPAGAVDLRVTVEGLRSDNGDVHVAIYDDPARFPDSDGMTREIEVPIDGGVATATFVDLAPATYALAVYHDEDGDNEFDQFIFGLPLEGYGFSNDAPVFFGPPTFEEAAFDMGDADFGLSVLVRY